MEGREPTGLKGDRCGKWGLGLYLQSGQEEGRKKGAQTLEAHGGEEGNVACLQGALVGAFW